MKFTLCCSLLVVAAQLQAQNVGIGTNAPVARLHVSDSSVLFSGPNTLADLSGYGPPVQGPGFRMMWVASQGAFRAGYVGGTQWDKSNIGKYSAAFGNGNIASGQSAMAMGTNSSATGFNAMALGNNVLAAGTNAVAFGDGTRASGSTATAMGAATEASGTYSAAFGIATRAVGSASIAAGAFTKANAAYATVVGVYNDTTMAGSLFEVGNGSNDNLRRNAFTVLQNGNVGIGGGGMPTGLLSFTDGLTGNKIVLSGNGTTNHIGIGVQQEQIQLYTASTAGIIAFGSGRSEAFTERVRIANGGSEGMVVKGRLTLQNGTTPINPAFGAGIWLALPDNSNNMGFMGVQNSQNIGFFGGSAGWGLTYNTQNSRVGIGNANPNAPLSFGNSFGKKISLYPGPSGDAGIGVAANRLQIFSDNPNADIALGFDDGGVFVERFAVKPNGAIAANGITGTASQVLVSNGSGAAATWTNLGNVLQTVVNPAIGVTGITVNANPQTIPGSEVTITVGRRTRLLYSAHFRGVGSNCLGCIGGTANIEIKINNNTLAESLIYINAPNGLITFGSVSYASYALDVDAGTYTVQAVGYFQTSGQPMTGLKSIQTSIMAIPIN